MWNTNVEARINGHYVFNYTDGEKLAEALVAEKPNDLHAFPVNNQLLTEDGWKCIKDLSLTDKVMQWHESNNEFTFTLPSNIIIRNNNKQDLMYEFTGSFNFKMTTTSKHRILLLDKKENKYIPVLAEDLDKQKYAKYYIPLSSNFNLEKSLDISDNFIKLIVATQADGHLNKDSSAISFTFVKENKIKNLITLLDAENISYSLMKQFRKERYETTIRLNASTTTKSIRSFLTDKKEFSNKLLDLDLTQRLIFLNEIQYWDGTKTKYNTVIFDTTDHVSASIVSTLLHLSNLNSKSYRYIKETNFGSCEITRIVFSQRPATIPVKSLNIKTYTSTELVGCVSVPSTYILVKQDNSIFISGNCLDEITEVLTKKGWKSYSELTKDTFVAQYNPETQIINYTLPKNIIINEEYQGEMIEVKGDRLDMLLTPNHRCLIKDDYTYKTVLANELFQFKDTGIVPVTGLLNGNADVFSYLFQHLVDHFYKLNKKNKVIKKPTGLVFRSFNKEDLEDVQKACLLNNVSSYIIEKINKGSYKNDPQDGKIIYQIFLSYTPKNLEGFYLKHTTINTIQYKGTVWCLEVPTNYIVCRRNGKVFITGNSINAQKLGIDRNAAKSFGYAIMFGAAPEKLAKMLGITIERAEDLYNQYWEAVLPLKELKTKVEKFWTKTGKQYILGLDGRHLNVRSKHSLINLLFQSGGAILCKWSLVNACERLEELGLLGDPFVDSYDALKIFLMIIYHKQNCGFVLRNTSKTFLIAWKAKLC